MRVDMRARGDCLRRVTDRAAVFHDPLAGGDIAQRDLVPARDILAQRHAFDRLSCHRIVQQCRHHIRCRNLDRASHVVESRFGNRCQL